MNTPNKRNINITQQPSNIIIPIKQNINFSPQYQQNLNINQKQIQQQNNLIQQPQNIIQNQKINLPQQNINIHRNPNLKFIQKQNNNVNLNYPTKNQIQNLNNPGNIQQNISLKQNINNISVYQENINNIQNQHKNGINPLNLNNIQQLNIPPNFINKSNLKYSLNIFQNNQNFEIEKQINERSVNQINNNQEFINNINQQNIPQNQEHINKFKLQQIPDNIIIGNIIVKNGKAYYINPIQNNNIISNMNNNNQRNQINNNYIQPQNISVHQNQNYNYINNNEIISGNINIINNQQMNNQRQIQGNQIFYNESNENNIDIKTNSQPQPQPPQQLSNSGEKLKNGKKFNKKMRSPRSNRLFNRIKDSNDHRPALQYKVERNRPVYALPPSKKRSVSQGKPFNLIHKYYDENYILEDDDEESMKLEEETKNQLLKNISDVEDTDN